VQEERNPAESLGISERGRNPAKDPRIEIWRKANLLNTKE
jgi:hypothetical protein